MVKLVWENKKDITSKLEELRNYNPAFFKSFEHHSFRRNQESNIHNNSKFWVNRLFWGDNLEVLLFLLNNFKEKIDLIYIDPPFFSGTNYRIKIAEKDKFYDSIAYYDHWDKDLTSYLQMLYDRLVLFKEILSDKGIIFIHSDWHASHYIRLILDEIFGEKRFINNIIWYYYNKYSAGKKNLPRAHDNILVYSNSNDYTFNEYRIPRKKPRKQLMRINVDGILKNVKDKNGHVKYRIVKDKKLDDVWKIPCLQPASREWTGFPTQKHHNLLERIIKLGSNEGDLIADFFCGSGTSLSVADKLKRRWIGCDISEYSIYLTRNRILNDQKKTQNYYPFEILTNLNEPKIKIIESGFFEKELSIKRKK
ncbi:MAG: site-specific DNA-methyltransferase [Promethearchaeota archaeon]|nr:MAG: site-specific DNA-methyltransferase [Candidatus Lokiarchaeota archaeon]